MECVRPRSLTHPSRRVVSPRLARVARSFCIFRLASSLSPRVVSIRLASRRTRRKIILHLSRRLASRRLDSTRVALVAISFLLKFFHNGENLCAKVICDLNSKELHLLAIFFPSRSDRVYRIPNSTSPNVTSGSTPNCVTSQMEWQASNPPSAQKQELTHSRTHPTISEVLKIFLHLSVFEWSCMHTRRTMRCCS